MKTIVVLTGAGISAESGISTFRDSNGLWEGHDVKQVASPSGYFKNKALVLEFYNQRRRQINESKPNQAHILLAELETHYQVNIITQNVDDLHEKAHSSSVLHLHGEIMKSRSEQNPNLVYQNFGKDINIGDLAEDGYQLRPFIVWFDEEVPLLPLAVDKVKQADILLIIGSSMQVYPAASLYQYAKSNTPIYYIDPTPISNLPSHISHIKMKASDGVSYFIKHYLKHDHN